MYIICRATFEEITNKTGLNELGYQALVLWHSDGLKERGTHRMVAYVEKNMDVNEHLIEQESFQ